MADVAPARARSGWRSFPGGALLSHRERPGLPLQRPGLFFGESLEDADAILCHGMSGKVTLKSLGELGFLREMIKKIQSRCNVPVLAVDDLKAGAVRRELLVASEVPLGDTPGQPQRIRTAARRAADNGHHQRCRQLASQAVQMITILKVPNLVTKDECQFVLRPDAFQQSRGNQDRSPRDS